MSMMKVDYSGGIGFEATTRHHHLHADLPPDMGGEDKGMTPPELFMASLGTCVGVYVVRYAQNAKLDTTGLSVSLDWKYSDDKTRISEIAVFLTLPSAEVGRRESAILQAAHHCLIHNTILGNPKIQISLRQT
jgi:putative redox protein